MKKFLLLFVMLLMVVPTCLLAEEEGKTATPTQEAPKTFVIYSDYRAPNNHYIASGWMGDNAQADPKGTRGDFYLDEQCMDNPHSGTTCIKVIYTAKKTRGQGWTGVYWQNPANNWGDKNGGFDLSGMTKLTFWARGSKGGEIIDKVKVGGMGMGQSKAFPDSSATEIGPIELTDTWNQYTVNLAGKDLTYISGGFAFVLKADLIPEGCTFYLDDLQFEADPNMKPETKKPENTPFYIYSDSRSPKNHYVPSGWMPGLGTNKDIKYENSSKEDPYLGDACIKIAYKDASGNGWAGLEWLPPQVNPGDSWGKLDVGYDLSKATKLTFWARGSKGGEVIDSFKLGGVNGEFSDSDVAEINSVVLNKEWTQYTIDLKGKDMSYIIGGFAWATSMGSQRPESKQLEDGSIVFYLDEIKYE
jgi:hypothetical protein